MSEQPDLTTARLYQQQLRDAAATTEQWAQGLRLAADMIDTTPDHLDLAVRPALSALGAIARAHSQAVDHSLLLAEYLHISHREIAERLGITHPTVARRIKRLQQQFGPDAD